MEKRTGRPTQKAVGQKFSDADNDDREHLMHVIRSAFHKWVVVESKEVRDVGEWQGSEECSREEREARESGDGTKPQRRIE